MHRFSFQRGCLGFIRDYKNEYELLCYFDEDLETYNLEMLPVPQYSYPLEEPRYLSLLGSMEYQMNQVFAESSRVVSTWQEWSIEDGLLQLSFDGAPKQSHPVEVLGTFRWSDFQWDWQVEEPLFPEDAYSCKGFLGTWDQIMELGYLTTARLNGSWLFVGKIDDKTVLLCTVFRN